MKKYLLLLLLLTSNSIFAEGSVKGDLWIWEENSKAHTFSIRLLKVDNGYSGTYCAVGASGNRMDCSPQKYAKWFNFTEDNPSFTFITNRDRKKGKAKLTKQNNKWVWELIEPPKGEHYAPKKAVLKKYIKTS